MGALAVLATVGEGGAALGAGVAISPACSLGALSACVALGALSAALAWASPVVPVPASGLVGVGAAMVG